MMETKSRYEVIAELEGKKRDLIKERDGLDDEAKEKENQFRDLKRQKDDTVVILDRKIADAKDDMEIFKNTMEERKTTVKELIASVDESLKRFTGLGEKK